MACKVIRTGPEPEIPHELQLITVEQLAVILGRSPKSLAVDVTRSPRSLPPVFRVPGSRKIRFRYVDVLRWMEDLSAQAQSHRDAVIQASDRSRSGFAGKKRPGERWR